MAQLGPVPSTSQFVRDKPLAVGLDWLNWFLSLRAAIGLTSQTAGTVNSTAQAASVATTDLNRTTLRAGLYRVTYAADITQAASVNSSLTVALAWTFGGVSRSFTGAAMTGNTTATTQGAVVPMNVDNGTSVTYAAIYSSTGPTPMQYALRMDLEALP